MYLEYSVVLDNARAAYLSSTLQAQQVHPGPCLYSEGCAIGATYKPPIEYDFDGIAWLEAEGVITTDNLDGMIDLQILHDQWVRHKRDREFQKALNCEKKFRKMVGIDQ